MKTKINGKKLLDKLTDLGWDYQCMTQSGRETYDEIMTMFGVLEEGVLMVIPRYSLGIPRDSLGEGVSPVSLKASLSGSILIESILGAAEDFMRSILGT